MHPDDYEKLEQAATADDPRLLPCPFCGSDEVFLEQPVDDDHHWYIQCNGCWMTTDSYGKPVDVIDKWNRRAGI